MICCFFFTKNEKARDSLIHTGKLFGKDVDMLFGIENVEYYLWEEDKKSIAKVSEYQMVKH